MGLTGSSTDMGAFFIQSVFTHSHWPSRPQTNASMSTNSSFFAAPTPVATDPCNPSPCGPNALCRDGVCTCLPEYFGDPYRGCRPECVVNEDCPRNKACRRNKCVDPCPGTCGQAALCLVQNHVPTCVCPEGMTGDPFVFCHPAPRKAVVPLPLCDEFNKPFHAAVVI